MVGGHEKGRGEKVGKCAMGEGGDSMRPSPNYFGHLFKEAQHNVYALTYFTWQVLPSSTTNQLYAVYAKKL